MGSSVRGHLMLMRSEATARSSSSSSIGSFVPATVERVFGIEGSGESEGNQVDALGIGGAWSSGYLAS